MTHLQMFALYGLPIVLAGAGWLYAIGTRREAREIQKHHHAK